MPDLLFPTIYDTPLQLLTAAVVVFVAQVVYVVFGFGSGLIAVGTLALVFHDMQDVVVLLLLVNLPAELTIVVRSWREITWRRSGLILAGVLVGIPLGTYVLQAGSPAIILTGLGSFLLVVGAVFLFFPKETHVRWPAWTAPPLGLISGSLAGLFGTPGPPLIVYFHLTGLGKSAFRGSLMALFLAMTFLRLPSYVISGLVTPARLWSGLMLLPVAAAGGWMGHHLHLQVSEGTFRRLVSGLVAAIGLLLIVRQLSGLP
jgi:uncharacterized membrane protein YfcA